MAFRIRPNNSRQQDGASLREKRPWHPSKDYAEQKRSPTQALPAVRTANRMAQKMGTLLGSNYGLQRTLPSR
jgi:hypothetical protein